jgi:hypothetical protein
MKSTFDADGYRDYQAGDYSPPDIPVLASEYERGWLRAEEEDFRDNYIPDNEI